MNMFLLSEVTAAGGRTWVLTFYIDHTCMYVSTRCLFHDHMRTRGTDMKETRAADWEMLSQTWGQRDCGLHIRSGPGTPHCCWWTWISGSVMSAHTGQLTTAAGILWFYGPNREPPTWRRTWVVIIDEKWFAFVFLCVKWYKYILYQLM